MAGKRRRNPYYELVETTPILTREEEEVLFKALEVANGLANEVGKETARQLRTQIILANQRLVIKIADENSGKGLAHFDLIQEGNIGLMRAVKKFDYKRGFRFATYAENWVRQNISRALDNKGRVIRLPVHVCNVLRKLAYWIEKLDREPTEEEAAEYLSVSCRKACMLLSALKPFLSYEELVNEKREDLAVDFNRLLTPSSEDLAHSLDIAEQTRKILLTLTPREEQVLRLRFGIEEKADHSLEDVAERFGTSRERIRNIEAKALRKLRHPTRSDKLKDAV